MTTSDQQHRAGRASARGLFLAVAIAAAIGTAGLLAAGNAGAEDLQGKLDSKKAALGDAQHKKGVLTTTIDNYNNKIDTLTGQVASLRNREAVVRADLRAAQSRLNDEQDNLRIQRVRLERSLKVLRQRLIAIYKTGQPDALTVVLESDGYNDLLQRSEYLSRIQEQDSSIVGNVRDLRNQAKDTVDRIKGVRNEIAAKKRELERTKGELVQRKDELASARSHSQQLLGKTKDHIDKLDNDVSDIEGKIQKQLMAASGYAPLPAGPIRQGSGQFIWPVNGPISSPFGMRWGTLHPGVDIAVPAGTPIRAAGDGTVALMQPEASSGGYGNYTCIDHGGGISTCYAHQSRQITTVGQHVSQGDVIGYVGCTGYCFGDHLHFEVRINGQVTDPMPYL